MKKSWDTMLRTSTAPAVYTRDLTCEPLTFASMVSVRVKPGMRSVVTQLVVDLQLFVELARQLGPSHKLVLQCSGLAPPSNFLCGKPWD